MKRPQLRPVLSVVCAVSLLAAWGIYRELRAFIDAFLLPDGQQLSYSLPDGFCEEVTVPALWKIPVAGRFSTSIRLATDSDDLVFRRLGVRFSIAVQAGLPDYSAREEHPFSTTKYAFDTREHINLSTISHQEWERGTPMPSTRKFDGDGGLDFSIDKNILAFHGERFAASGQDIYEGRLSPNGDWLALSSSTGAVIGSLLGRHFFGGSTPLWGRSYIDVFDIRGHKKAFTLHGYFSSSPLAPDRMAWLGEEALAIDFFHDKTKFIVCRTRK